jgi:polyhydroxyalkanoate synthase subunit PhaC
MRSPGRRRCTASAAASEARCSVAVAAVARNGDERLGTLSLFAAETEFTEAGELTLFISGSEIAFLEDLMWEQDVLDSHRMAGAFQFLRSNDMIWSRAVRTYVMGEREAVTPLMAWNAEATRMPCRMHSEYLRRFFLENAPAAGGYEVDGRPIAIRDIEAPISALGTETDHVAPWRLGHKVNLIADAEVAHPLTNGGRIAGVVSPPAHAQRHHRILPREAQDRYIDPEAWVELAEVRPGFWWPSWDASLAGCPRAPDVPPPLGARGKGYPVLAAAPGAYVLQP